MLATLATIAALIGLAQSLAGWLALRRFRRQPLPPVPPRPPITVLKPLHGAEPLLEEALASLCALAADPNSLQIICGIQSPDDPARHTVARLQSRFPALDLTLITNRTEHGANRKVANLLNMLPTAKHDLLVIADSDVHCLPTYLDAIATTLAQPNTGLATLLYTARPATHTTAALLGAAWINHTFLPGALLARALGRQDCLGATMALTRQTLASIGGLETLSNEIADDQWLGRRVAWTGQSVRLAPTIAATTIPETTIPQLWHHELRWARTIRALEPAAFALSALQHPLAWSLLAIPLANLAPWALAAFLANWATRHLAARLIDAELSLVHETLATRVPIWLLPARDLLSMTVLLAAHCGRRVEWRGQILQTAPSTPGIPKR